MKNMQKLSPIPASLVDALKTSITGELLCPGDAGFDLGRKHAEIARAAGLRAIGLSLGPRWKSCGKSCGLHSAVRFGPAVHHQDERVSLAPALVQRPQQNAADLEPRDRAIVTIDRGQLIPIPFTEILDAQTGKAGIRLVDIDSDSYKVARHYMIRPEAADFEDPKAMARLTTIGKMPPKEFERRFGSKRGTLDLKAVVRRDVVIRGNKVWIVDLLRNVELVKSGGEARRKIAAGAVRIDGDKITDPAFEVPFEAGKEMILRLGREFRKIVLKR